MAKPAAACTGSCPDLRRQPCCLHQAASTSNLADARPAGIDRLGACAGASPTSSSCWLLLSTGPKALNRRPTCCWSCARRIWWSMCWCACDMHHGPCRCCGQSTSAASPAGHLPQQLPSGKCVPELTLQLQAHKGQLPDSEVASTFLAACKAISHLHFQTPPCAHRLAA